MSLGALPGRSAHPGPAVSFLPALLLLGLVCGGGGASLAGGVPSLQARSLVPLDTEAIRCRYGQEALSRLRLGVEAVPAPPPFSPRGGRPGPP